MMLQTCKCLGFVFAGCSGLALAAAALRYIVVIVASGLAAENPGFWKLKKEKKCVAQLIRLEILSLA